MAHPAEPPPSPARTALQLGVELAAFAALLFLTRFVLRGYLALPLDEECHIGGVAVDVLAAGIRFPSLVYVQSDYDNGSLLSGLLAAGAFTLLGRNLLALKLVTHLVSAAGAVAALWLLRGCLRDLGLTARRTRWTAVAALAIGIALAPEAVTLPAMCTVGFGSPPDGAAIDMLLLALFARRWRDHSALRVGVFWVLVGLALHLNRATLPVIPVLAAAEAVLARRAPWRLLAAAGGFLIGGLRDLLQFGGPRSAGWAQLFGKAQRHASDFPDSFLSSVWNLAEQREALIIAWTLAVGLGIALLLRALPRFRAWWSDAGRAAPLTLALVVGAALMQLLALLVMAQGGFDYYTIYGYPLLMVLYALLVAWGCARAGARWHAGPWLNAAAVAVTLILYRPLAMAPSVQTVASLWRNRAGAACSWRLAEGFRREYEAGLAPPGRTMEEHLIARCRALSEPEQVLDCIGGISRDRQYTYDEHVDGAPPAALTPDEARAYAYYYGIRRNGDARPCADFTDPALQADCRAAVRLDCIARGGWGSYRSATPSGPPRCAIPAPPMDGYWAALRTNFLTTTNGIGMRVLERREDEQFPACKPVFDECY